MLHGGVCIQRKYHEKIGAPAADDRSRIRRLYRFPLVSLHYTNTDSPYDEIGITLNNAMPGPINAWGCAKLKTTFGTLLATVRLRRRKRDAMEVTAGFVE